LDQLNNIFKEDIIKIFDRDIVLPLIVIGSGMSCTIDKHFGMNALADFLSDQIENISKNNFS
jgi:hypothetical protein